jgi:hypothetical protein
MFSSKLGCDGAIFSEADGVWGYLAEYPQLQWKVGDVLAMLTIQIYPVIPKMSADSVVAIHPQFPDI